MSAMAATAASRNEAVQRIFELDPAVAADVDDAPFVVVVAVDQEPDGRLRVGEPLDILRWVSPKPGSASAASIG